MILLGHAELLRFSSELFVSLGMSGEDARLTADVIVEADLRGVHSHGVMRLEVYERRLRSGVVDPKAPHPSVVIDAGALAIYDGHNAMGQVASYHAMRDVIRRAREHGIAAGFVRRSNHSGIAAYYAQMAAVEGMAGQYMTSANASMAPWGGRQPMLGSNPVAFAFPPAGGLEFVLDMSTATQAKGKVLQALGEGKPLPSGWALDEQGLPTTDPSAALKGTMVPLGGPKGFGLSLWIDILSGVASGANFGPWIPSMYEDFTSPQNCGHYMQAVDLGRIDPGGAFSPRLEQLFRAIKSSPPAVGGSEILLPGEPELGRRKQRLQAGIPITEPVYASLVELANAYGLALPG